MKKKNLKTGKRAPELKRGKPVLVQRVVRVRQRTMLIAYSKVVNSIAHLNDEERRRVIKAANITCGEAP